MNKTKTTRSTTRAVLARIVSARFVKKIVAPAIALNLAGACSLADDILEVNDPDILEGVNSAAGALALRNGVFLRLAEATTGTQNADALFLMGGLLADEWRSGDTFVQRNNMDQRIFDPTNTFHENRYRDLNRVRVEGERAISAIREFAPDSTEAVGMLFALRGLAEVLIGEHYCNGSPLSGLDENNEIVFGAPLMNDEVFQLAVQSADSALAQADGSSSALDVARVVKARALLDRGLFDEAAAAVADVPHDFRFNITHSINANENQIWSLNVDARRYTMVDREGDVGLDYVSSNDPRLPTQIGGGTLFDSALPDELIRIGMWYRESPVTAVSGIEAELIRAEVDLRAGRVDEWLDRINALRTNTSLYPEVPSELGDDYERGPDLTELEDPGDQVAREDIMFRERAFWMFATGHRLGDMRRLVRQYDRPVDSVYPNGAYFKGGTYRDAVNIPIAFQERNNPNFTECVDRNP